MLADGGQNLLRSSTVSSENLFLFNFFLFIFLLASCSENLSGSTENLDYIGLLVIFVVKLVYGKMSARHELIDGNFWVLAMNVVNSIVRIPIKDYIGLLTLKIVKRNVRSPMEIIIYTLIGMEQST